MSAGADGSPGAAPTEAPAQGGDPGAAPPEGAGDGAQGGEAAASAEAAADAAQAAVDKTKQQPGESEADFKVRLSKVTREARLAREEAERHKGRAATAEEALKQARADLERAKKGGISRRRYLEITRAINEAGDDEAKLAALFDDDDMESLPKAVRDEIEAGRRDREERKQREQQQNFAAVRAKETAIVGNVLKELAEECPLYEVLPHAAAHVLNGWHDEWARRGGKLEDRPDIHELAVEMHKPIADNLMLLLQSDKARSFLLRIKPELKALLGGHETAAGGPTRDAQGAGRGNGPPAKTPSPTVPSTPTSVSTTTPAPKSRMELEEEELEASRKAYAEYQLSLQRH